MKPWFLVCSIWLLKAPFYADKVWTLSYLSTVDVRLLIAFWLLSSYGRFTPPRYRDSVLAITPGLPLFLYNYTTHQLHGRFEVCSCALFYFVLWTFTLIWWLCPQYGSFACISFIQRRKHADFLSIVVLDVFFYFFII